MLYLLFAYSQYYPSGGMGDCLGVFTTLNEAKAASIDTHHDYIEIVAIDASGWRTVSTLEWSGWEDQTVVA